MNLIESRRSRRGKRGGSAPCLRHVAVARVRLASRPNHPAWRRRPSRSGTPSRWSQSRARAHSRGPGGSPLWRAIGAAAGFLSRPASTFIPAISHLTRSFSIRVSSPRSPAADTPRTDVPVFLGYPREDGRAGTRNYIAVAAASNCAAHTVEASRAATRARRCPPNVDGVVAFPHGEGCGHAPAPDIEQLAADAGRAC